MKKIIAILLSVMLGATLLVGCGDNKKESVKEPQKQQMQQVKKDKKQETINLKIKVNQNNNGGKPYFIVETNLPDDTNAMVTLENKKINYMAQTDIKIVNGKAETEEFSNNDKKLKPGNYKMTFSVSIYENQPKEVQEKIGENYKNVKSKYLDKSDLGNSIIYEKNIVIK